MFETLALDMTPRAASLWFGLGIGVLFGAVALLTRFCLRRALVGPEAERASARGVWALALIVALMGTQAAVAAGLLDFGGHRFFAASLPVLAIVLGGLLFGVGAVLARGCITRLTVLTGGGNLRALVGLFVFAVVAHMTLQGVLMPLRTGLGSVTVDLGIVSLAALPGGAWVWTALIAAALMLVVLRSGAGLGLLAGAVVLGALVPVAWVGTGYVLYDEFDPITFEGIAFTSTWADTLFWSIASSLREPGFGVGLIGGVLAGAVLAAVLSGRFVIESFSGAVQMGRTLSGSAMMGFGGVLAGGCTVGAGLSGVGSLSIAAILALVAIAVGMLTAGAVETRLARGTGPAGAVPAE